MTYEEYLKNVALMVKYSDEYYNLKEGETTEIDDEEYDLLRRSVMVYEIENGIPYADRYSTKIGAPPDSNRVAYHRPMLSLENALNATEASSNWIVKWSAKLGAAAEVIAEWKFDGMATRLRYVDGNLTLAITRGDSEYGKDITHHAIHYVPKTIKMMGVVEIDGETVMNKSLLEDINASGEDYANCRNAVSGMLNRNEPNEWTKHLSFYPYGSWYEGLDLPTYQDGMAIVKDLGFEMQANFSTTVDNIQHTFDVMVGKYGDSFNFDIDGVVFKVNSIEQQKQLGATIHSPNWAFAYKRPPLVKSCTLLSVEFQLGRTGEISPVGKITPTSLMGVVVTSVLLHNEQRMKERGTEIGNTYEIFRSGDVIPHLGRCLTKVAGAKEVVFPSQCPSCKAAVIKKGAFYYCSEPDSCRGIAIAKIAYGVSREALDVAGIAEATVTELYDKGRIRCAADILALGVDDLEEVGISKHVAGTLVEACKKAQRNAPEKFIIALGISDVGKSTARNITSAIYSLEDLLTWTEPELIVKRKIPGVGPGTAGSIAQYFSNIDNFEFAKYLFSLSKTPIKKLDSVTHVGITGETFVFSGSFDKGKDALEAMVISKGGNISSSVGGKTSYLVYGPGTGEKYRRAQMLKVPTLTEKEFLDKLDNCVTISTF